ncbi:MAG: hypothetical protein HGB27_01645 [Chlorobiaceae bacterium]|nr:hypothetical protein [Chlorobiaceae bacterium]
MRILIATAFLDSHKILEYYYDNGAADFQKLQRLHFAELYARAPYKPDHFIISERQAFFEGKNSLGTSLTGALEALADMLYFRGRQLYVKTDRFDEWQGAILSASPLLVIAFRIYLASSKDPLLNAVELIRMHLNRTCLPSVYEPHLENVCQKPGLTECHMHLNGTVEPDIVWQDALQQPVKFYRYLRDSFRKSEVEEQYLQLGRIEPQDLYRLLQIAVKLRDCLIGVLVGRHGFDECSSREKLMENPLRYASTVHPMNIIAPELKLNPIQYEALFLLRAFSYLDKDHDVRFAARLHYYLLISSFFQKLLVQQKRQVGFDQFQKITLNQLREHTEKQYSARFQQLQGMHGNHLAILEGRFAPKDSRQKLEWLMMAIKKGYKTEGEKPFELKLVPHFLKEKDVRKPKEILTFRDLGLRLKNIRRSEVLLDALRRGASDAARFAQQYIVGFDAAANELHASPEVFAPVFRKLAFMGYANFTYHAGEDFVHLLSGMRAVYEAVEFLEMMPGNRIGHATVLGIEPKLWFKRIGKSIHIKKGEWLDNLIFTYQFCSDDGGLSHICRKLEQPIFKYFSEVYQTSEFLPVQTLIEAWLSRKYDPFIALKWREPGVFDSFARQELEKFRSTSPKAQDIYRKYHSRDTIRESNKLIQIASEELVLHDELRLIQCRMIEFLNKKQIAIEMPPSSNVRISHYKSYDEHHMLRWLGLTHPDDPKPVIVPGSDDTGIFMTNLRNEYAHIQRVLESKTDKDKADKLIADLVRNSNVYSFKRL